LKKIEKELERCFQILQERYGMTTPPEMAISTKIRLITKIKKITADL